MSSVTDTKWFMYGFSLLMILFGVAVAYGFGGKVIQYRAATTQYLPVQARILSHDLETVAATGQISSSTYMPVIEYEYTVDGQTYQSDNVLPVPLSTDKAWAEEILANFPIGTIQTAYYNPARPDQAYLQKTGYSVLYYVAVAFGAFLLLLGFAKFSELLWKDLHRS